MHENPIYNLTFLKHQFDRSLRLAPHKLIDDLQTSYGVYLTPSVSDTLGEIVRTGDAGYAFLALSIERAEKAMAQFAASERCLIHGDAHAFNLLEEGDTCLMIDPLGYVAPYAFEWARYLGTAMKEKNLPADYFRGIVQRLSGGNAPVEEVLRAFAIDTTLRACNTFIEGNTYQEICFAADWARRAWDYYDALKHT